MRSITLLASEVIGFARLASLRKTSEGFYTSSACGGSTSRTGLALHEKRLRDFCMLFLYLSFACLFGARACYLSFLTYSLAHPQQSLGGGPSHRWALRNQ